MVAKKLATIGMDIGGTKTLMVLFDEHFKPIEEVKGKTQPDKGEKRFNEMIDQALDQLVAVADKNDLRIEAAGAGCAGFIDEKRGMIRHSPNIQFLEDYPLASRLTKRVKADALIANDVHAGLYGEHQLGAASGLQNVIGIFLGTGIGGAVILNNRLYVGSTGTAGEIGHYLLNPLGPLSGSERQGILDDVASRTAIAAEAAVLAAKQWAPHLYKTVGSDVADIKSGDLADSIKHGDEKVEELVRSRARTVGIALSNLVDFLCPDMVVLGGGLVEAMPKIVVDEVEKGIKAHTLPVIAKHVKVARAELGEYAVAAGAAKMALDAKQAPRVPDLVRATD